MFEAFQIMQEMTDYRSDDRRFRVAGVNRVVTEFALRLSLSQISNWMRT